MSCCPPAPSITIGGSADQNSYLQESDLRPGESVDCFQKRAGDSTGRKDDKTEDIPNKIRNTEVPMITVPNGAEWPSDLRGKSGIFVDTLFRLTPNSTKAAATWEIKNEDGTPFSVSGVTLVPQTLGAAADANIGTGALLRGAFGPEYHSKIIKINVIAKDNTAAEIDKRAFTFSPAIANGSNEIRLLHPLPGQPVSSKFGPRKPPTTGASSMHGGVDFNTPGTKLSDVLCAADGTVEFTGFQAGGAGNYIKIKHLNGAGKHLCTTVYMHLSKMLVEQGQKVSAGQKIGIEGNTGVGTGPHLHFELRLPNGTKVDPEPYIKGDVKSAQVTNPDNTAVQSTIETRPADKAATLTEANVDAKQNGCEPLGPSYPKDPAVGEVTPPTAPITDPFERAWFLTMTHEVGPFWTTAYPNDPEVQQGLIQTPAQRKKCGYVDKPGFPGGNTKFGIAAGPNGIKVEPLTYEECKKMGYNNYWKRGAETLASGGKPKTSIVMFDVNYLHGVGNGNKIRANANITSGMTDEQAADALAAAQQAFMNKNYEANPTRNGPYIKGWLKRSREVLAYAKATP